MLAAVRCRPVVRRIGTFARQSELPRLPIVPLEETAGRYLRSCKPVLTPTEYAATKAVVTDFIRPGGIGEKLQQRLQEYDRTQPNSWLESIWLDKAYLSWRESTLINVNWWLEFVDTPGVTEVAAPGAESNNHRGYTEVQLRRASGMITNLLNFKDALDSETLPPETMGKKRVPLCMNQYRMQFGVCRVPKKPADYIVQTFPAKARHIIVMLEDQIYKVPVLGANGERVSIAQLQSQLQRVVQKHQTSSTGEQQQPAVGLLTSEHRDKWTEMHEHMCKLDVKNQQAFRDIEDSLFAVSLEPYSTLADADVSHRIMFHGQGARNRWFDKSLSFIFMNNGHGGCNGEHSPSDAVIPGRIMGDCIKAEPARDPPHTSNASLEEPVKVTWTTDNAVHEAIEAASTRADKEIADIDSVLLHFNKFGSEEIKSVAKCSPDAFVQMAMQLTWYRIYKEPCPTYESASVRQFLHGRTETIRACSEESVAFTAAFDNDKVPPGEKISLFRKAVQQHVQYSVDATNGRGVDRHLLGLRMMQATGDMAPIFADPAYLKSMNFRLSTSNVSPGDYFYGGFGPVTVDGYGVNYAIGKAKLKFSIASRRQCKDTCSRSFRKMLDDTLTDLLKASAASI